MIVKSFPDLLDYQSTWEAMKYHTSHRQTDTPDEVWLLQHHPVYTLGQAGKPEHILHMNDIPVIKTDRGGQVTYHGPGQLMAYVLMDLRRQPYFVKDYVFRLEQALINTLGHFSLSEATRKAGAPGVYLPSMTRSHDLAKVAALGVKVSSGCTYHGLSLNINMDLSPFLSINPCGYAGLETVDMASYGVRPEWTEVQDVLVQQLKRCLLDEITV